MQNQVGVVDIQLSIPKTKMTIEDMCKLSSISKEILLKKTGLSEIPILDHNKGAVDMAIDSAHKILKENDLDPNEIDFIIYCSTGVQDKYLWSPAAKVQQAIKAKNAFSFEVNNGCNAGNLGINIAKNILQHKAEKKTALVVLGDALSRLVDRKDPNHLSIYNFSDCSAAMLLRNQQARNIILSSAEITVPNFVDHMYLEPENSKIVMNDDDAEDAELGKTYCEMYPKMIIKALKDVKLEPGDISCLFMNQGDHGLINKLAQMLHIPQARIYRSHQEYGHMGGCDVFFGMNEALKNKKIKTNDIVVLASSAVGFSWSATVIRV